MILNISKRLLFGPDKVSRLIWNKITALLVIIVPKLHILE